jgi:hypothetical protein
MARLIGPVMPDEHVRPGAISFACSFRNQAGTRTYKLYVPACYSHTSDTSACRSL